MPPAKIERSSRSHETFAITQFVNNGGDQQSVINSNRSSKDVIVKGEFVDYRSKAGITVHGGVTSDLTDCHIVATAPTSIIITILLEGKLVFGYDDLHFELDAIDAPQALIANLKKPATFHKRTQSGNNVKKINIMIKPEWFNQRLNFTSEDNMWDFLNTDKAHVRFEPSRDIIELLDDFLQIKSPQTLTEMLKFETNTLLVMSNAFEQVSSEIHSSLSSDQPFNFNGNISHLISYLESNLDQELSLEDIASYAAMSTSNLQRRFKHEVGYTVLGYVRYRRLARAKQALEQGYKTITEAAYDAGYQHPSNFTNAFKKQFGYSPSDSVAGQC